MITLDFVLPAVQFVIIVASLSGIFYAVFKTKSVNETIATQATLIDTLKDRLDVIVIENKDLMKKHIENEKAIADLHGQIKVYKELPLQKLADNMEEIQKTNKQILLLVKEHMD